MINHHGQKAAYHHQWINVNHKEERKKHETFEKCILMSRGLGKC
jgi:hypothetical protein